MLSVIIISFNSASIIDACQKELLCSDRFKTIIVDNASPDGSAETLRKRLPNVEVIALEQNIGYGRAANVGLRKVETPYALLLNPDLITTTGEIEKLLAHVKNDTTNTAIWGPATYKKDYTGDAPKNINWISGGAMLFDVKKIKQVGLFDENIFLFSEETDLCERTLAAGHGIKWCRDVFFDHLTGQACPFDPKIEQMKWWHFGWSQCYRMTKNGHCTWLKNPKRKYLTSLLHSLVTLSRSKRIKWQSKATGAKAFIAGEKAFDNDGNPKRYSV